MNIVGILIQFQPRYSAHVERDVLTLGCEVHLTTGDGKMVVTLEHVSDQTMTDTLTALQQIPGILTATLVYHHYDVLESE